MSIEVNLHFGMHRDVGVIHEEIRMLDGIVVPAHILAHQKPSTSAFITSLPAATPYLIDPVTYRFQSSRDKHLNPADELRASTAKLCAEFHPELTHLMLTHMELSPALFPAAAELTERVVAFQLSSVEEGSRKSAAKKYLDRYERSTLKSPRVIVPPYFRFEAPGDTWYKYSLECALAALGNAGDTTVAPIITAPWTAFGEVPLAQILTDFADFQHIILWIDNFHESFVTVNEVQTVRRAINAFAERVERVEAHYGGYLLLLAAYDGLASIGHGILYSQHKSFEISGVGQGGASERYYIPGLRQFRSLSQTDLILHQFPELICPCPVCQRTLGDDPDRIVAFFDEPELLRRHFLNARRAEADAAGSTSLAQEAAELRSIYERYHQSLVALRNPDAIVTGSGMQGLRFLLEWADGIEAPLT